MKNLIFILAACVISTTVWARPPVSDDMELLKAAMDECAAEFSITLPEPGSRERPSREVMEQLDSCMADKGFEKPKRPPHGDHEGHGPRDFEGE